MFNGRTYCVLKSFVSQAPEFTPIVIERFPVPVVRMGGLARESESLIGFGTKEITIYRGFNHILLGREPAHVIAAIKRLKQVVYGPVPAGEGLPIFGNFAPNRGPRFSTVKA